jgi:hypothetical protein
MTAAIGQQHLMTGQVSAMWNIFLSIPMVGALLVGGWLSGTLEERDPDEAIRFLAGAAVMASVSAYAIWKPKILFDGFPAERSGHPLNDLQRLLRHGPIAVLKTEYRGRPRIDQPLRSLGNCLEYRLHVRRRISDDFQDVSSCSLSLQRLLGLVEKPRVFDCDQAARFRSHRRGLPTFQPA